MFLCAYPELRECRNSSQPLTTPLRIRTRNWTPKTHENIIVPVEAARVDGIRVRPVLDHVNNDRVEGPKHDAKSVYPKKFNPTALKQKQHKVRDNSQQQQKKKQEKRNPKNYNDGKGNYFRHISYDRDSDEDQNEDDKKKVQQLDDSGPNKIQPLHTNTEHKNRTSSVHKHPTKKPNTLPKKYHAKITGSHLNPNTILDNSQQMQKKIDYRSRLQIQNLPPNPTVIPRTTGLDNLGFHYGVVHNYGNIALQEVPPPKLYKSSYRDPQQHQQQLQHQNQLQHQQQHQHHINNNNDNLANLPNLLYKSEIYYPSSYRQDHYPAIITYGDHNIIPVTEATVYHGKPNQNQPEPKHIQQARPMKPLMHRPPPPPPPQQRPGAPKKNQPPQQEEEDEEEGDDEDEEGDGRDDDEEGDDEEEEEEEEKGSSRQRQQQSDDDDDEEEDSSEDDGASNDRYNGGSEEDVKSSSLSDKFKPVYRFRNYDHDNSHEDKKSYGYGFGRSNDKHGFGRGSDTHGFGKSRKDDNDDDDEEESSYESSETNPKPKRIKFYHEKMTKITTPMQLSPPKKIRTTTPTTTTTTTTTTPRSQQPRSQQPRSQNPRSQNPRSQQPKKVNIPIINAQKKAVAPEQQPRTEAGKDDLKYFQ